MTHICVSTLTIIGSDNDLSPGRRQAIIWTNAGILLIRTLGTNFSEIFSEIRAFPFMEMHLKMSSAKWRPFCLGLNVYRNRDFYGTDIVPKHSNEYRICGADIEIYSLDVVIWCKSKRRVNNPSALGNLGWFTRYIHQTTTQCFRPENWLCLIFLYREYTYKPYLIPLFRCVSLNNNIRKTVLVGILHFQFWYIDTCRIRQNMYYLVYGMYSYMNGKGEVEFSIRYCCKNEYVQFSYRLDITK